MNDNKFLKSRRKKRRGAPTTETAHTRDCNTFVPFELRGLFFFSVPLKELTERRGRRKRGEKARANVTAESEEKKGEKEREREHSIHIELFRRFER